MLGRHGLRCAFVAALTLGMASAAWAADDGVWSVSKATGEVWIAADGAQQVALNQEETLKPGNTIRTGRNGRVLLVRGEETILISPNSVVGLPAEKKDGLSTTIIQQAGSILLEVEKRNVKHFEVETPYLAAVVKGTQFSVTVGAGNTKVGVIRGQVEVSDFKTGQVAQIMPGQSATAFEHGKPGLSLGGTGTFNPIEHGKPRASTIERIPVPKSGLSAPRNAANGHAIHALGPIDKGNKLAGALKQAPPTGGAHAPKAGVVRISSSLGEVKLNVHKVTHGLAHGGVAAVRVRNANANAGTGIGTATVWSDGSSNTTTASNSSNVTAVAASSSASTASAASASSSATTTVATTAGSSSNVSTGTSGTGSSGTGATGNGSGGTGNNGNSGNNGHNGNGNNGHHYGWYWGRGHH
ncbi:FecR domain-containing protein [Bradyrhizobium sp. KB893862 SZCCT0404]|uniref:FecR family protein n=1 Tax=Bradyrhizobium sp. KB893862 SZCCT0404 TaxID=2807672 RepID=UPI001BABB451|nr:FecR family protein [Bradyrhizobium sp. KB893862 SZCCT0404]MBR1174369.1 FecR domain-containing protein [Bradyrhizobium sp. KB893862 SZCCT0404]